MSGQRGERLSRRHFVGLAGATLALPATITRSRAAEIDVVIIGAGSAGLSAAITLLESGRSVQVIEAANRIGGRAHTDTAIFGVPYDIGAHWLHNADDNPFVWYAEEQGFDVYPSPEEITLYVGDREASTVEENRYYAAYAAAIESISRAGRSGRDIAPAEIVPDGLEWNALVHLAIGPWEMGKDFDSFSCADWWSGSAGVEFYCREGYGTLLSHSARDVPVTLSTPARSVDWSGGGVTVETPAGTIRARTCIVTVSMGVLAAGNIRFEPGLPAELDAAISGVTMGLYNHIALQYSRNVFGTADDTTLLYQLDTHRDSAPRGAGLLTNISGTGLTYADVGGSFAAELEAAGAEASIDFARGEVRKLVGTDADGAFVKGHATAWGRNRLTHGSYASAEPGHAHTRAALRHPLGDRVWFAGEACSRHEWATLAGAWKNGRDVAMKVNAAL